MEGQKRVFGVTYSSGLWIKDQSVLATLAVFYDEIWLPWPGYLDDFPRGNLLDEWIAQEWEEIARWHTIYAHWKREWNPLFDHGLLRTLQRPSKAEAAYGAWRPDETWVFYREFGSETEIVRLPIRAADRLHLELLVQQVFYPKPHPELFLPSLTTTPPDTSTTTLATALAQSLFRLQVPQLQALGPEQILEVRDALKDTKEGFADFIFEMTDEVEGRLGNGATPVQAAADKTAERKILTKYREFRRQLEAKRTGWWANVLAAGGKFLQIDAAPWTPKFYGSLLEIVTGSTEERVRLEAEARSNAGSAFQYLARLEREVGRVTVRRPGQGVRGGRKVKARVKGKRMGAGRRLSG